MLLHFCFAFSSATHFIVSPPPLLLLRLLHLQWPLRSTTTKSRSVLQQLFHAHPRGVCLQQLPREALRTAAAAAASALGFLLVRLSCLVPYCSSAAALLFQRPKRFSKDQRSLLSLETTVILFFKTSKLIGVCCQPKNRAASHPRVVCDALSRATRTASQTENLVRNIEREQAWAHHTRGERALPTLSP